MQQLCVSPPSSWNQNTSPPEEEPQAKRSWRKWRVLTQEVETQTSSFGTRTHTFPNNLCTQWSPYVQLQMYSYWGPLTHHERLKLRSHCREKWPKSNFFICFFHDSLNTTNLITSKQKIGSNETLLYLWFNFLFDVLLHPNDFTLLFVHCGLWPWGLYRGEQFHIMALVLCSNR